MALRLGDLAPDFSAPTTEGPIQFHQWLGDSWGVLFSHPADYTPVCTTELGMLAKLKGEFTKRNVKVAAISVDPLDAHHGWSRDINETQGCTVNFPINEIPEQLNSFHGDGSADTSRVAAWYMPQILLQKPDGTPYNATDPRTLAWVHVTEAFGFLQGYRRFAGPVPVAEADRYYDEARVVAERLGARDVPRSEREVVEYFGQVRGELAFTDRSREVLAVLDTLTLPDGYGITAAGEIESRQESFGGLGAAILIAVFGILAILILEFKTFRGMLIVSSVIPLGVIGGLAGLWVTGYTLSFSSVIGFVALIGIEIKSSILLVDFTNQLRAEGVGLDEAIEKAGKIRFVPIVLTSLTAIGGLVPLAIQGSSLYSPLAIVIIGGLVSSTLLSRLVTPVLYKLLPPTQDQVMHTGEFAVVEA